MESDTLPARHWTLDPMLERYFLSAGVVAATCLVLAILANLFNIDDSSVSWLRGWPLRVSGLLLGMTGALSALFLWLGMLSYWWQVDRREQGMNPLWLMALSIGNWVGAVVYYFVVFRRITKETIGRNSL